MKRPILQPPGFASRDASAFIEEVSVHPAFDADRGIVIGRAPGRLDLMGGIADYSGSLVLQWPLREATLVAAQIIDEASISVTSLGSGDETPRKFSVRTDDLFPPGGASLDYEEARKILSDEGRPSWASYVVGVLVVLARERQARVPKGLRVLIRSSVPEGKGVSSSAALEVATMQALAAALDLPVEARDLALLAQKVENRIVGAACGVMDQMTASAGVAHRLLALRCQPAELLGNVALPDDLEIWGLDSGIRHAVSGSDYSSVRTAAFMGARILAARAGLLATRGPSPGKVEIDDRRWGGYLANVTPSEIESGDLGILPQLLSGEAFLSAYGGITDPITSVDPKRDYAVRACAMHPINEHFRVRAFAELLEAPASEQRSARLGELMYQSHASYSACGLGCADTDLLVRLVRDEGPRNGFFGAKITGGGSGGTVAVLGRPGAEISRIARAFEERVGRSPQIFSGSSSGSAAFGVVRLGPSLQ